MWRTEIGDRGLKGTEAEVFQWGLERLVAEFTGLLWSDDDELEFEEYNVGVRVFDALSGPEKLAILEHVAHALLAKSVACPQHTAVAEGAIAAVYHQLVGEVEVGIDEEDTELRKLLLTAARECGFEEDGETSLPAEDCDDHEAWCELIEYLMFRILWDTDWENEHINPDDLPERVQKIREFAGIEPEYYTAVPSDPNPAQLRRAMRSLTELWNMKVR